VGDERDNGTVGVKMKQKLELRKSVVQDQVSGFLAILRLLGVTEDGMDW